MSTKNSLFRNSSPFAWWKIVSFLLLLTVVVMGFTSKVPRLPILNETIRNLYFHVPMWFGMTMFLFISLVNAIRYLRKPDVKTDVLSVEYNNMGLCFGVLGLLTGMVWAKATWGTFWTQDPKLNAAAIGACSEAVFILVYR